MTRELFRIARMGGAADLCSDGNHFAVVVDEGARNRIRIMPMTGVLDREIVVRDGNPLNSLNFSPDGKAFFCGEWSSDTGAALIRVEFDGRRHVLWRQGGSHRTWGFPSPDGKYLAIRGETRRSDVWLVEGL